MKCRLFLLTMLISLITLNGIAFADNAAQTSKAAANANLLQRPDVQQFIQQVADKYHIPFADVQHVMAKARLQPGVIDAMNRPYEAKPWYLYRTHFLTQQRIEAGTAFWHKHADTLAKAEKVYGVPASVIVAIIGVETNYGEQQGNFSVLNALTTLAFEYPKRETFFKKELAEFIALTLNSGIDPKHIKGSYAGAIGQPQFMPSSYRHYAVDFAKDGHIDLFDNTTDVIGSVANYLRENGWQREQPIADLARLNNQDSSTLANSERKTPYTVGELRQHGIQTTAHHYPANLDANLLGLAADKQHEQYWLGFHNFYVITRYNTSVLYAMAVYQLSQQISSLRHQQLANAADNASKIHASS